VGVEVRPSSRSAVLLLSRAVQRAIPQWDMATYASEPPLYDCHPESANEVLVECECGRECNTYISFNRRVPA